MANPLEALQGTLGGALGQSKSSLGPLGDLYGKTMDAVQASPLGQMFHGIMQPNQQQADTYARNQPYVQPGASNFNTQLPPLLEQQFRGWVDQNRVPFDPSQHIQDYDMRGFFQGLMNGHPKATSAVNPNDGKMHFPDFWKTPFHETFSNESQWAGPMAPKWNEMDQLISPGGKILFDERKRK